jgi:hypothetical protein
MSVRWVRDTAQVGTVDLAFAWIMENVPRQSLVLIESRALLLPSDAFRTRVVPQFREMDYTHWRDEGADYLVATSQAYGQYLEQPEKFPREYAAYMSIFEQSLEVATFSPSKETDPQLRIFKVIP